LEAHVAIAPNQNLDDILAERIQVLHHYYYCPTGYFNQGWTRICTDK